MNTRTDSEVRIVAASPFLGADVTGVSVKQLVTNPTPAIVETLKRALDQHLALRFRQPTLENEEIIKFAQLFGRILTDRKNTEEVDSAQTSGHAELKILSNAQVDAGKALGDKGAAAQIWHTDGSHRDAPNAFSVLYAREAPKNPPRTGFINAYSLYEKLPSELKREIADLRAIFSIHNRSQDLDLFLTGPSAPVEKRGEGPHHPLVRLHPSTRRPFLYLPRRRDALIAGWSPEKSRQLLERLWAAVFAMDEQWHVALEADDFVIFDNRAVLHNREGWSSDEERTVFHVAIEGEAPIAAFAPIGIEQPVAA